MFLKNRTSGAWVVIKLMPLLLPFLILFTGGLIFAVIQSFGMLSPVPIEGEIFTAYEKILTDPWFSKSFFFSIYIGFFSALFSVIIGTALAYFIWQLPGIVRNYTLIYKIPLILPHITIAFLMLLFLGKTGIFSSILYHMGAVGGYEDFPSLLFSPDGTGMIISYIYKEVPFVILMTLAILQKINPRLLQTAKMLGAGRIRTFFTVIFPLIVPVLNTCFIILFLYSFGAFDIPFILNSSRPEMLSIRIYNLYFKMDLTHRPEAMAALVLMFLFSLIFIYLYSRVVKRAVDTSDMEVRPL